MDCCLVICCVEGSGPVALRAEDPKTPYRKPKQLSIIQQVQSKTGYRGEDMGGEELWVRKEGGGGVEEIYPAGASAIKKRFFVFLCQTVEKRTTWLLTVHSWLSRIPSCGSRKSQSCICVLEKHLVISSLAFPKQISSKPNIQYNHLKVKFQHIGVD